MFPLCTYKQMNAAGSVNTIVMHCESHNIFSPSTIAHEIRKCVLYMVHSNIGICSLCKKLPWAPWMLQELWTERSAAVTAPSSPQTNKFRGAKGMKTFFFFCLFFLTRWCFYKKCYLFMTALSAASHSVQRQRWSGRSHARVAGALSLTVFARVSGAAAGMHVTHTAFRVAPRCVSIANRNRTSSFD